VYVTESWAPSKAGAIPADELAAWLSQEFQDFMESIYHDREPLAGWSWRGHHRRDLRGLLSAERGGSKWRYLNEDPRGGRDSSSTHGRGAARRGLQLQRLRAFG